MNKFKKEILSLYSPSILSLTHLSLTLTPPLTLSLTLTQP